MRKHKDIINIANFLSFSRIIACIPLIICFNKMSLDPNYKYYSIFIIIYIVLSDVLDGFYARKANVVTDLGKVIDPVADKISFITVLVYLINAFGFPFFLFFILLSIRDIVLLIFTLYFILYTDYVPQANSIGKLFIFVCVLMIIFHIYELHILISNILFFLSVVLLLFSTVIYIKEHLSRLR